MLIKIDGKELARLRRQKKYTQADLASEAGISQQTLAFYESGKISSCKEEVLRLIASKLDVAIECLAIDSTYNRCLITYREVIEQGKNLNVSLSMKLMDAINPSLKKSVKDRAIVLLDHLFDDSCLNNCTDSDFLLKYRLAWYQLVGDFLASIKCAEFTSNIYHTESYWTEIIHLLKINGYIVPATMIDELKRARICVDKVKRDLLVLTYHEVVENYDELIKNEPNLAIPIHKVLTLICCLLTDSSSEDNIYEFCKYGSALLLQYIKKMAK